jgi:Carboxypeptidase regulatory-like domain
MRLTWVAILLVVNALPTYAQSGQASRSVQPEGTISGFVLDSHDRIVEHASVCTSSFSNNKTTTNCRTLTDENGRFTIEHVSMGSYSVVAAKEEDSYSMVEQIPGQKVVLTADRPFAQLTLKLGPRSGRLTGTARDKGTGKPIGPEGKLSITYVSVEGNSTGSMSGLDGANLRANLPAGKEFIVFVSAPGYVPWFYINNQSRPTLRLEPGEEKVLDVELEPKNTQSQ